MDTVNNKNQLMCDRLVKDAVLSFLDDDLAQLTGTFLFRLQVGEKTMKNYGKTISYFFSWLRTEGIARPSSDDMIRYKEHLLSSGLAVASVNSYLASVRCLFKYLNARGLYPNVCVELKKCREEKSFKRAPLSKDQAKDLLENRNAASLIEKRNKAIVSVMIFTGLRSVSVRELRIEDLVQVAGVSFLLYRNKGSIERNSKAPLPSVCADAVRDYLTARNSKDGKAPLFEAMGKENAHGFISERGFQKIIKKELREHGMDSRLLTAHSLRHTFGTLCMEAGADLLAVSQAMHHADVNTTRIYVNLNDDIKNAPAIMLAEYLGA